MDGSYGNVFPTNRGISPGAPAPSGNQYKVNVSRQKTKKWANFKPQNYDGDDWGDDYDESAHEPEPLPLPKPLGPRQPAAHSPTTRPFPSVGSPPSRTHNEQYAAPASAWPGQSPIVPGPPPPMASEPPRRVTEPFEASPHSAQGHFQPRYPPDATRASPSPNSPHPLPSQLPPREDDVVNTLESTRQSGPGPQTSDDSKPWLDTRSASPRSAAAPPVSLDKPLPLIRPADLYKRMGDERLKGRPPNESGPSAAANDGAWTGESPLSEIQPQGDIGNHPIGLPATEDFSGRALQPATSLASIPERQSEYGIESLLASYGGEGHEAGPIPSEEHKTSAESQKSVQPLSLEHLRRSSTSPQLPDLTRMSGFGEDLFSSSLFPPPGLRSPISGSMQLPTLGEDMAESSKPATAEAQAPAQSSSLATAQGMAEDTARDANLHPEKGASQPASSVSGGADHAMFLPPNESSKDQRAELPSHKVAAQPILENPEQQIPAESAEREPAWRNEATRPHMPGNWVTENPTTPPNAPAPSGTRPHMPGNWVTETPSTLSEVVASQITSAAHEEPGKASVAEGVSDVDARPELASIQAPDFRKSDHEVRVASDDGVVNNPDFVTVNPASSPTPPPLGKASPSLDTQFDMGSRNSPTEMVDRKASPASENHDGDASSPILTSSTTEKAEIHPTAPLNPRRGTPDNNDTKQLVLPPQPLSNDPTRDAESPSVVKDSDKLSEEIMKSLSPVQSGSGFLEVAEGSTAAYPAAAAEPTRESSYLGDVYGDYWATPEDKVEPSLPKHVRAADTGKAGLNPLPSPVKESAEGPAVAPGLAGSSSSSAPTEVTPVKLSDGHLESSGRASELQKRFSWDVRPEEPASPTASPPPTEQLAELGSGAEDLSPLAAKLGVAESETSQPSPGLDVVKPADELRAESAPEFNPVGAPAPTAVPDRLTQPSPSVSDMTEAQGEAKGQSLAEEKIALRELPQASSPPPPLELHPAFARVPESRLAEASSAPSPKNIVGFRDIMEMPLPAERIKLYSETRSQFAAVDTGLEEWLKEMVARYPEHVSALLLSQGTAAAMASHAQHSGQQAGPLPASLAAGQGLRVPGHLHMPQLQHGLSGLGHSSNQVGTKSKELLMAAGKAGKGLFSKGRNKLRGAGNA
ncbi:hypothetical protein N658DRAFT_422441 [Parathielavia hyrcaniae]|uniref:Uncharacterized protein n=1 Tax=Parathielavia hyrcaniae TaxID=113614 RepID=A0AAN6Q3E5_9PEZI|nr:hypothetical protein N658DRAFT_422441 [Parathielavia hyrcaniae]